MTTDTQKRYNTNLSLEPEGQDPIDPQDVMLAARVGETLERHYPGHGWRVHVSSMPTVGMLYLWNNHVSFKYGMRLKLATVYTDPGLLCVIRSGGELLERANHRRGWRIDGWTPVHIDGVRPQDQPFKGIII